MVFNSLDSQFWPVKLKIIMKPRGNVNVADKLLFGYFFFPNFIV